MPSNFALSRDFCSIMSLTSFTAYRSCWSGKQCSTSIGCLQPGQFMNENTILGDVHLVWMIVLTHLTWKTCLQPNLMQGSVPRAEIQQIVQYESSLVSSRSRLLSSGLPASTDTWRALSKHSCLRQGRHSYSPKKPRHGCVQGNILSQFSLTISWHSCRRQMSSKAPASLFSSWLTRTSLQNLHFLLF